MNAKRYAGVIVKYEDKFLICKRNDTTLDQGEWSIPAGRVEDGEKNEEAAKREFFEETSVNIDDLKLSFVGMIPRYTKDGSKIKGMMYTYKIDVKKSIKPDLEMAIDGDEHSDWGYYTLKEIRNMKINTFLYKLLEYISEN